MRRRELLGWGALSTLHWLALGQRPVFAAESGTSTLTAAGDLLDLPKGFRYQVVQRAGQLMSDGHLVPIQPDGMALFTFGGPAGSWVLLRNHELGSPGYLDQRGYRTSWVMEGRDLPSPMYRTNRFGGVSRVVVDPKVLMAELGSGDPDALSKAVTESNMALGGTDNNCAGGKFPSGWVSCEETDEPGHGWAFLVTPEDTTLTAPRRLDSWGRFQREGVALDPGTAASE